MKLFLDLFQRKIDIRCLFMIVMILSVKVDCFSQDSVRLPDSIKAGETIETYKAQENNGSIASQDSVKNENLTAQEDREDSVVFRGVPDSVVKLMKSDRAFVYANNPAYWKNTDPNEENNLLLRSIKWVRKNPWAVKLLYVLFGAILLVVIYIIVIKNKLFIFYSSSNRRRQEEELIIDDDDPDFSSRIQQAISANDFRNAIRYLYLKTLKMAGEKKLIRLNIQSTNQEYLNQLESRSIKESFRFLTDVYEKTCYGGFDIRQDQFLMIRARFDQLFNAIAA